MIIVSLKYFVSFNVFVQSRIQSSTYTIESKSRRLLSNGLT